MNKLYLSMDWLLFSLSEDVPVNWAMEMQDTMESMDSSQHNGSMLDRLSSLKPDW